MTLTTPTWVTICNHNFSRQPLHKIWRFTFSHSREI